jgi:hypothetical protein
MTNENLPELVNQLSSKDLFEAFKIQLAKDFQQSNFPFDFIETLNPDFSSIHENIITELERNQKRNATNLMQLLYRIDISEAQLKRVLHENKNANYFNVITELIIKRVLQKVVIKLYYKKNESEQNT